MAFLGATGQNVIALALLFYARERFSASASQIGCLAGSWSISYMFACMCQRRFAARILPRYSILTASFSISLVLWGITKAPSFPVVFALYSLQGVLTSLYWPALMGWLSAGLEGKRLSRTIGGFNVAWSTGGIVSPLIAGRLSDMRIALPVQLGATIYLLGGCGMLAAILALPSLRQDDSAHSHESATAAKHDGGTPLRFPAWLGVFTVYTVLGVLISVFPVIGQEVLALNRTQIGNLLFLRAAATTVGLAVLGRTVWWHFRLGQMQIGLALFALVFVALASTRAVPMVCVLMILAGFLTAQGYVNSLFHGVTGSVRRAARMAMHEALLAAGLFTGSAAGGRIFQTGGDRAVYMVAAALLGLAAITQGVVAKHAISAERTV